MLWHKNPKDDTFSSLTLQGDKIFMRAPKLEDWKDWSAVRAKNQMRLKPYEPSWAPDSLSQDFFRRRYQRQKHDWLSDRHYPLLIFNKEEKSLIGGMNINNVCRGAAQFASLGYWIDHEHEGRGLMSEALQLTLELCFSHLNLHRVQASCLPQNKRSKNLLLKNGFVKEGFAKNYLRIDGRWQDHILFGACHEDFYMS